MNTTIGCLNPPVAQLWSTYLCQSMANLSISFARQDRLYRCYMELLRWLPSLRKLLASHVDGEQLIRVYEEVRLSLQLFTDRAVWLI